MIYKNIKLLRKEEFRGKKILAVDFGATKFGVAISDVEQKVAMPKKTYLREDKDKDIKILIDLLSENETNLIIFGLSLDKKGNYNKSAQQMRSFVDIFLKDNDVDVFFWDERYSTVAAQKSLAGSGFDNIEKNLIDDKVAASLILQAVLDFINQAI
jgi:putative holliday junction resolvase